MNYYKLLKTVLFIFISSTVLFSCGTLDKLKDVRRPVDLRKEPLDPDEKARRNISEGRGISLGSIGGNKSTTYEFSTSNPMWRATLSTLDFLPLVTVDYSGGLIITDWYNDDPTSNESLKLTIRFLSNQVQSNSLNIKVHKKTCLTKTNNCSIKLIKSSISQELSKTIITTAAKLEKEKKIKK